MKRTLRVISKIKVEQLQHKAFKYNKATGEFIGLTDRDILKIADEIKQETAPSRIPAGFIPNCS